MSKNNTSKTDMMFEEIMQQIRKIPEQINKQLQSIKIGMPSLDTYEFENLIREFLEKNKENQSNNKEVLERIEELEEKVLIQKPKIRLVHHHRISIDIESSKTFLILLTMGIFLFISLFMNYKQREANHKLADNDLKYRYIKSYNQIDSITVAQLENIFEYNRRPEIISKLRKDVKQFERYVQERAKRIEEARLKEQQAEVLQKEADKLKK